MSKSSQRITIDVDFNASTSQLEKSVKNIRNLLNEWDFSSQDSATLIKSLTQAETLITKAKAQSADGIMDKSGLKQNQNTIEKINLLSKELDVKIKAIRQNSSDIFSKVDASALEKANNLLGSYNAKLSSNKNTEKIKQLNDQFKAQSNKLSELQNKAKNYSDVLKKSSSWDVLNGNSRKSIISRGQELNDDSLKGSLQLLEQYKVKYSELTKQLAQANKKQTNLIDTTEDEQELAELKADLEDIVNSYQGKAVTRTKKYKGKVAEINSKQSDIDQKNSYNEAVIAEMTQAQVAVDAYEQKAKQAADQIKQAYQSAYGSIREDIQTTLMEQEKLENSINLEENLKPAQQAIQQIAKEIKQIPQFESAFDGIDMSTMSLEDLQRAIDKITSELGTFEQGSGGVTQELRNITKATEQAKQANQEYENSLSAMISSQRQIEDAFSQAAYFFNIANAAQYARQMIQKVYETVKELDKSMTETAVVTDFSVGDMWNALPEYTNMAKQYGASIKDAYDVMTLYYQQGLDTNETMALGSETMQMARIASLGYTEATDRMTNALRGFNMELNTTNAQRVNDVYSELAAISASDVDELSKAMTKTASLANSANMSFENTAAFLAQIIETTRESAETA